MIMVLGGSDAWHLLTGKVYFGPGYSCLGKYI